MLCLEQLQVGYGRTPVTGVIDAALHRGEFLCLLGRNGTGKSTLLRTMAGMQAPVSGSVTFHSRSVHHLDAATVARLVAIVTTQMPQLSDTLVRDLVAYGRLPYTGLFGRLSSSDYAHADHAIEQVGISSFAHRRFACLSDGERQKVMIARALAQGTDFLLLDEPAAFLDYPSRRDLMALLARLAHQAHKGILLSTHDIELAQQSADALWLLRDASFHTFSPSSFSVGLLG